MSTDCGCSWTDGETLLGASSAQGSCSPTPAAEMCCGHFLAAKSPLIGA
jgi:hypothetical protein